MRSRAAHGPPGLADAQADDRGDRGLSPLEHALSRRAWLGAAATGLAACAGVSPPPTGVSEPGHLQPEDAPPPVLREFRAAWVATVAHIDWPSRRGLTAAQQRAEMMDLLDRAQATGLNALVLQVRPSADAIYPSALEPWSEYLTGASGRPPDVPWDPLAEWVEQSHRRGMELHAWFNPYRARHGSALSPPAPGHVAVAEAGLVRRYGDLLWLDPGEPRAAQRMVDVVLDVVQRYDIDGVHLDDYFYPYPVKGAEGRELPFPDDASWRAAGGGAETAVGDGPSPERAAWRRRQVDSLIERLYAAVHVAKPWVRVGISPFGLPRPDRRPPGITGFSQYDKLHADVERWLSEGWLDYLAPQLYWPIGQAAQAFPVLLDAWRRDNALGRHLWPGLFTSRIGDAQRPYPPEEVLAQIEAVRDRAERDSTVRGHLHFSMAALAGDRAGIARRLRAGPYAQTALPPATPWLAEPPPGAPRLEALEPGAHGEVRIRWREPTGGPPWRHAVLQQRVGGQWQTQHLPVPGERSAALQAQADRADVRAVGLTGVEGPALRLARGPSGAWQPQP